MAMRYGGMYIETVAILCPLTFKAGGAVERCGTLVTDPSTGSQQIDEDAWRTLGGTITCAACGGRFLRPAVRGWSAE